MSRDMTCSVCEIEYHTRDYSLPFMCDNCKVTAERDRLQDIPSRITEENQKLVCLYPIKPKCRNKGYTDMDLLDEETKEIFATIEDLPFPVCKKHILEILENQFQNDKEIKNKDKNKDIEFRDLFVEDSVSNEVDAQAMLDAERNPENIVIKTGNTITTLDKMNTGTYRVITRSGTRHIIDFDNNIITRYGAVGHEWGKTHTGGPDAVPYKYSHISPIVVGESMKLMNMATWRQSSTVMSIEKLQ